MFASLLCFQGSVTDFVCRHATLPVLVVRGAACTGAAAADNGTAVQATAAARVTGMPA